MNYTKIVSKHNIKKYDDDKFDLLLNNINSNNVIKKNKTIDTIDRISHILLQQYDMKKINDIMTTKKSISDIINYKTFIINDDKTKEMIMDVLCQSLFIPFTIINWIELQCNYCTELYWDNIKIFILDNSIIPDNICNHIIKIVKWLIKISKKSKPKIKIFIYLSDFKKELGDGNAIGNIEMNSGVSFTHHWIQIFRKEELYKVLIHELIHYLELDVNIQGYCSNCSNNIHVHDSSQPILINEGYVEAISLYLYCVYCGREKNIDPWLLLLNEEKYTIYQINKIFKYHLIDDISYFATKNTFVQNTNVIPYFILKYLFLINIRHFLKYFYDKHKTEYLLRISLLKLYKLKIPKCKVTDKSLKLAITTID